MATLPGFIMSEINNFREERRVYRGLFTKLANKIDASLKNQEVDIELLIKQLIKKYECIFAIDGKIRALMFTSEIDEDELTKEIEECESYNDRLDEIQFKFSKLQIQKDESHSAEVSSKSLNLPKIKLLEYDGDLRGWTTFWGQFSRIDSDQTIRKEDKFQYLLQSLKDGSKPRKLVEKFPATSDGYDQALDHLKSRFGQKDLLIELYVRDLIHLVSKSNENKNLCYLYDQIESYLRSLTALGIDIETFSPVLYPLIESCLPKETLIVWEREKSYRSNFSVNDNDDFNDNKTHLLLEGNKLQALMQFLRKEAEGEERVKLVKEIRVDKSKASKESTGKENDKQPTCLELVNASNTSGKSILCFFCNKSSHPPEECRNAQKLNLEERLELVNKNKACLICLKKSHFAKNCRVNVRCMFCGKRHFLLLCKEFKSKTKTGEDAKFNENVASNLLSNTFEEIMLQTLCVKINGKCCRVLLDSGSQHSYISKDLVSELNIESIDNIELSHCLFGAETKVKNHQVFNVNLCHLKNNFTFNVTLLDEPKICGYVPKLCDINCLKEIQRNKEIFLCDSKSGPSDISVLLGSEAISKLYTGKLIQLKSGPCAIETFLGWCIMGRVKQNNSLKKMTTSTFCLNNFSAPKALWDLETLGILDPAVSKSRQESDDEIKEHFKKNVKQLQDGRYEVTFPWFENISDLETNFPAARKRLENMTRKLLRDNLVKQYEAVFKEWESLEIIEEVPLQPNEGHFLAHHAVVKFERSSTKIRPVFDASLRGRNQISLNDCLPTGPNLLELIPVMLMRFRMKRIGVVSDLSKAFLQISINEADRTNFKFLWWANEERTILKCFQHKRVVFGVVISPYLLSATIEHHIYNTCTKRELIDLGENLMCSFYVDDFVSSVSDNNELNTLIENTSEIMRLAKFDFKEWIFTKPEDDAENSVCKVLGVKWNYKKDLLCCNISEIFVEPPVTKRKILSVVNKIAYDPIGYSAPATVIPKIILRKCWELKLDWNQTVPDAIAKEFKKWVDEIKYISDCKIPRWIFNEINQNYTIHVFCDASQDAYGCCIFIRSENGYIQLVLAKSRLAPLKPKITIPRLELMAALIGARLYNQVIKVFNQSIETVFWTDSTTVLSWIWCNNINNNIFVKNRVKEILNFTNKKNWSHIAGELNTTADLISRGCSPSMLPVSRWWEGPSWLKDENWRKHRVPFQEDQKSNTIICLNSDQDDDNIFKILFERISAYHKIIRVFSYIRRFTKLIKREIIRGDLTSDEIESSEILICKFIQEKTLLNKDKSLNNIVFETDSTGLLRVRSKLIFNQEFSECFVRPIVLPDKHDFVDKLIEHFHKTLGHAGVMITLCNIREKFWVIRGRRAVQRIIDKCVVCRKLKGKPMKTAPAVLPIDRIQTNSCFSVTGIDTAGPAILRDGSKCWIIIFTCATYRAVHFELVTSLSTDCFLLALR